MKKLLLGLFIFGFLAMGSQAHASVLSDALLKIDNLTKEITQLRSNLSAAVFGYADDSVVSDISKSAGTISATNCIIPSGSSTCNTTLVWNIVSQYIGNIPMVITPVSITIVKGQSSGTTTYPITYGSRIFSVISNPTDNPSTYSGILASATATATCASGTTWNGSICITTTRLPSITVLSPNGGKILVDNSVDSTNFTYPITWSSSGIDFYNQYLKIDLYRNRNENSWIKNIVSNKRNDGVYQWVISGKDLISKCNAGCVIKISTMPSSTVSTSIQGWGDVFTAEYLSGNSSITVLSPNGGEGYYPYDEMTVKWSSNNISSNSLVNIYLVDTSTNLETPLITNTPNDGIQGTVLGNESTFGKDYIIKIIASNSVSDTSDSYFKIYQKTTPIITISSPINGEKYKHGNGANDGDRLSYSFKIDNTSGTGEIKVYLVDRNNMTWPSGKYYSLMTYGNSNPASQGLYVASFLLNNTYSNGNYYLLVDWKGNDGSKASTYTGNPITITDSTVTPSITVLSPNGGETYKQGDKITVKWKTENIPSDTFMQIVVYRINSNNTPYQGFNTYPENAIHDIVGAPDNMTLNDGSETIFVDFPQNYSTGTDFKVYVRRILYDKLNQRVTNDSLLDWSDNYFTINKESTPSITVLSPNGGEAIKLGDTVKITWKSFNLNNPTDTVLLFLKDSSSFCPDEKTGCSLTASSMPNTGSYLWDTNSKMSIGEGRNISVRPGSINKIVACVNNLCDESDNYFTINSSGDAYVNLVYPQSGSTFKAGQNVEIKIDSNLTRLGAFRALIYRKNSNNQYVFVKKFDTANSGIQTLQIPFGTPAGDYKIDYGHIFSENDYTQYGTATFYLTSPPANPATPNYASSSNQTGGNDVSSARTLGLGMRGDDVTTLQNYLNGQGYNCGVADGSFGQMTKAALIRWQIANGLTPDGLFGRMGRAKAGFTE